jgi:hypothetical protein
VLLYKKPDKVAHPAAIDTADQGRAETGLMDEAGLDQGFHMVR